MGLILALPFVVILLLWSYASLLSKRPKLPPSPFKLPIIGNLHQLRGLPHRSLRSLSLRHGPLMLLHMGQVPTLVVSSAAAAEAVLKTHDLSFASRPVSKATAILAYGARNISFSPYNDHWRRAKKAAILHLLSPQRVRSFRPVREDEVELLVAGVAAHADAGEAVDLTSALNLFSSHVASRTAAGRVAAAEGREARFRTADEHVGGLLGGFEVFDLFPSLGWLSAVLGLDAKLEAIHRRLDELFSRVVEEHARRPVADGGGDEDLVDVLLSLAQRATEDFVPSLDVVKAISRDLVIAGTDTSFQVLDWAMAELVRNPTLIKKAQDEVRTICNGKSTVTEDDVNKMIYLKAVVKEVLRLHPPAPLLLPRKSMQKTVVHGYEIPANTRVIINAWAIARDPESWDNPEEFQPERFVDSAVDFRGHHFQFIPFGAGRRICPGIHFAITSIEFALANLLYHFDWALPDGMQAEDLDMAEAPGLTTPRKSRLNLLASRRLH